MFIRTLFANKKVWIGALAAYPCLLALTMYKDYVLTSQVPNVLFYITVPEIGLLGAWISILLLNRATKHVMSVLDVIKILFLSEFVFQIWENVAKLIYYRVWAYPGILWFVVFPVSVWLVSALFHYVCDASWRYSAILAIVAQLFGMFVGMGWMWLTGIETYGS